MTVATTIRAYLPKNNRMFDFISGNVVEVGENRIVVDCGGVGFSLSATATACSTYSQKKRAIIPVYLAVREDALELYGFSSKRERTLFLNLISVSGVGAKLAITLLSGLSADTIATAIATADVKLLSSVKGVGKKTAERLALELRDKISAIGDFELSDASSTAINVDDNAVLALMSLGYEKKEAVTAVKRVATPQMSTEEIVRAVLRG